MYTVKLFIPKLGTEIVLTKDWKFTLMAERRNKRLWELVNDNPIPTRPMGVPFNQCFRPTTLVTLMTGSRLKIVRIHIQKDQQEHDSVTFRGKVDWMGVVRSVRFWARLDDVNNINYEGFKS